MNKILHTLTAYRIDFSYMMRNNPLREELETQIKNNDKPNISLEEIIDNFISKTKKYEYEILSNNGKIILLNQIEKIEYPKSNVKRIFIRPLVGKRDVPIHIVNLYDKGKVYDFSRDSAATYSNNIFLYKMNNELYCVCHRQGGSGCKTIFSYTMNQLLRPKGIKMNMNWLPPNVEGHKSVFDIDKITLIYEEKKSSDIADEPFRKTKKVPIKKLTLDLNRIFPSIKQVVKRYQLKEISQEAAMNEIKEIVQDEQYNNAWVTVKIGKVHKKIAWDELEGLIDGFDITDKLANTGENFIEKLIQCSDDFIFSLIEVN